MRSMSAAEILRELRLPIWRVPAVLSDYRKMLHKRIDEVQPFPGITASLEALLDNGVALAVATSNTVDNVKAVLGHELAERFAALECGSALFGKSHRLRHILKQTSIDPAHAIYIGDELRDAEAAQSVGVKFGAVAWGYTSFDALLQKEPHIAFRVPADLAQLNVPASQWLPVESGPIESVTLLPRNDES